MGIASWPREVVKEVRENPAEFLRKAFKEGEFLATTEFKLQAEAGKPFVMRLEEACLPYMEIDYWRPMPAGGVMLNQLVASPHVFQGETEPRWTLNAHYQTIYREGIPWKTFLEGDISHNVLCVWASETTSFKRMLGNEKDSWLFPRGLSSQWSVNTDVLHASNY